MYQQLVLFPCCIGSSGDIPHIIHIFGNITSLYQEEILQNVFTNKIVSPLWKDVVLSDENYSYLPYKEFIHIDRRKFMYEKWKMYLPLSTQYWYETCNDIETTLRYSKKDIRFLSWMSNVIFHTKHVAQSYN